MALQLCLNPNSIPPSYTIIHINEQSIPDFCKTSTIDMKGTKIGIEIALATKGITDLINTHQKLRLSSHQLMIAYHTILFPQKFHHKFIDQYNIQLVRNIISL